MFDSFDAYFPVKMTDCDTLGDPYSLPYMFIGGRTADQNYGFLLCYACFSSVPFSDAGHNYD